MKKNMLWPVTLAKVSFVFVLIGIGIIFFVLIAGLIERFLGQGNFVSIYLRPYAEMSICCFFPTIILAISIGGLISFIGLLKTKEQTPKPYYQALISFVIGLAVIWFIAIALTIPLAEIHKKNMDGIAGSVEHACNNNLGFLGMSYLRYQFDNKILPKMDAWCDMLKQYHVNEMEVFQCGIDKTGPCSYAINENIPAEANTFTLPWDLVLFFESAPGWNQIGGLDDVIMDRHTKPGANICFANGRAEFVEAKDIPNLKWTVGKLLSSPRPPLIYYPVDTRDEEEESK
jgi:hypothetical protein